MSTESGPVGKPKLPDSIGPYRILSEAGSGGFGTVYEAEQTSPVRRRVALKVLKAGMESEAVVKRFRAERQMLVVLHHPNIAPVYQAGETEKGIPSLSQVG
jgi:serine/threonine protein kinase